MSASYGWRDVEAPVSSHNEAYTGLNFDFSDDTIRRGFIRKVYSILMCQIIVTLAIVGLFKWREDAIMKSNIFLPLFIVSLIVTFSILIVLVCSRDLARKSPTNLILLTIFTLAESVLVGFGTAKYKTDVILIALALTALVCFGLTLYAFQTKTDFTTCGGALFVALLILTVAGIVSLIFPGHTFKMIIAGAGVFLFSIYIIYDTQMLMGGKHKYSISPEEYIFATLNLYLDIVNLFMYIIQIVNALNK